VLKSPPSEVFKNKRIVWDGSEKELQAQSMSYQVFTIKISSQKGKNHA
jgi:hypothetical protein